MDVVFLSPAYPPEMQQYTRGLAEVGARVWGVGDAHPGSLPGDVSHHLAGYLQVPRIMDEDDVMNRVSGWLRGRNVDRVLSNWEPLVILAARLRERWGLPGMSVDTVHGFRDKELMKQRLRAAGVRVARSARVRTAAEVRAAARAIGYPIIVKPIAGAGSADTYKVEGEAHLEEILPLLSGVSEASVEEFIEGEEYTYDTVCIGGQPVYENVSRYLPKPLEARTHEWISPCVITVRDLAAPHVRPGVELGRSVLSALRMGDGFTHMEWFRTPKGEAVFGEIGCRPGGANLVDQMNYTSDLDLFREWARAVCWHDFRGNTERKYHAGIVFKRAKGQGRIQRVEGLEEFLRKNGRWVVEQKLLPLGAPRRNWKQTLISDGHVLVRHPEWDEAFRMCSELAQGVTLYAG